MSGSQQLLLATGAGGGPAPAYIEDVFATYLYTGNGLNTQTINNGIDLLSKGGLVWTKSRNAAEDHRLNADPAGSSFILQSNTSNALVGSYGCYPIHTSTGYILDGTSGGTIGINTNNNTYVSWTFRKQPKFFDMVTYTGNGSTNQVVNHNLGSVPGAIFVKALNTASVGWVVYHRSLGYTQRLRLNETTAAQTTDATIGYAWGTTGEPTATTFTVGDTGGSPSSSQSGVTYVAYLFAHNAGGFGLSGTDNVISCGSFTTDGSGIASVTLGYEPQYLLVKRTNSTSDWYMWDSMRGLTMDVEASLFANSSAVEEALVNFVNPTATGFVTVSGLANSSPYIYIAIRRGPMKTPTSGASVFSGFAGGSASSNYTITTGFPVDVTISSSRGLGDKTVNDRLRGGTATSFVRLRTNSASDETSGTGVGISFQSNTGIVDNGWWAGFSGSNAVWWNFRRAPGFFDQVCYSGNGSSATISHNLGVTPELAIIIARNDGAGGAHEVPYSIAGVTGRVRLNENSADQGAMIVSFAPSSFGYSAGFGGFNVSGVNYVAYLFASCPGVSKVGTYTGTGGPLSVQCGFTSGARFVMIKRTDAAGDWYVWDTSRGISFGNDPHLLLNSTAAEVTGINSINPDPNGFQVTQNATTNISVSGATYIYLAIA